MDLNMYEPMTDRRALYNVNSDKYNIDNVKKRNPKVAFENTDDVATGQFHLRDWLAFFGVFCFC